MHAHPGTLFGVGVGPGDPELLTLKAVRTVERCPVLAVPRTRDGHTLALDIVSGAVDVSNKTIVRLDFPMARDAAERKRNHAVHAQTLKAVLDAGQDIALLNIGDVSLFSTFSYVADLLTADGYAVETIPGVPSFCACAATMNRSLTDMQLPLHIFPTSCEGLEDGLDLPGGKVLMKPTGALMEMKALIRRKGLESRAAVVMDCGLPTQRVFPAIAEAEGESYFTTVLIRP